MWKMLLPEAISCQIKSSLLGIEDLLLVVRQGRILETTLKAMQATVTALELLTEFGVKTLLLKIQHIFHTGLREMTLILFRDGYFS